MVICAAAAGVVLGMSQGKIVDSWELQPAVILAIISAVSNIAFNSALAAGIAVRFWLTMNCRRCACSQHAPRTLTSPGGLMVPTAARSAV